jgi:hypothetical protein
VAGLASRDEPLPPQVGEVPRRRGLGQAQDGFEIADADLPAEEEMQDP